MFGIHMDMKSTSRCLATDICGISPMWNVPTSPPSAVGDPDVVYLLDVHSLSIKFRDWV
jgi:hypothetical protein